MSAGRDYGGPAFPGIALEGPHPPNGWVNAAKAPGMTLREYFAAHSPITYADAVAQCGFDSMVLEDQERKVAMAVWALMRFEYADAMLTERAK